MKKRFIILLTLLLFNLCEIYSQNWLPLSVNKTYHYSCDTTNTVFSLWIDSVSFLNTDSIYYTNRFILPCDTCDSANYPNIYATRFLLKNQPLFLQRKIIKNNNQIKLISPDTINISLLLNENDIWIFDSTSNQSATVYYKGLGSVLGLEDSIYCFKLDNSDTVIVSKNHGIIQYPFESGGYYRLIGIEGADTIGYHIPGYYEIYDFPNGAVFYIIDNEGYPEYFDYTIKNIRINERLINPDGTYNYKIRGCSYHEHYSYLPYSYYYETDSFEYVCSPNFFESYHIENYPIITLRSYQDTLYVSNYYANTYYLINVYVINGITYFEQKPTLYYKLNENYYYPDAHPDILTDYSEHYSIPHEMLIVEKNGLIFNQIIQFENSKGITSNFNLYNDPNGIQCDCCIVSNDKSISNIKPQLYYCEGNIYISGIESGIVELFSSQGQKLQMEYFKKIEESQTFNIKLRDNLSSGIYFVKVTSNNTIETIKVIVSD